MALEFQTDAGYGGDALGLIVLKTDQSMEPELRDIIAAAGRVLYHSRIAFATVVNAETLARMAQDIPKTTGVIARGSVPCDRLWLHIWGYGYWLGACGRAGAIGLSRRGGDRPDGGGYRGGAGVGGAAIGDFNTVFKGGFGDYDRPFGGARV